MRHAILVQDDVPPAGRQRSYVAFVGPAISCQDGRSTYGPLGLPAAVGVMTLITRQCFAIPTSSRGPQDREIDGEGPMGPSWPCEREAEKI